MSGAWVPSAGGWIRLEGGEKLRRQLDALGGSKVRTVARRVVTEQVAPVLIAARQLVPVGSGRLKASLGRLMQTSRSRHSVTGRIGTRRDFSFRSTDKRKLVVGRGKQRDKALARGYEQDKGSPNWYAGGIEWGTKKSGRVARKAGGAMFLNTAMKQRIPVILNTITAAFERHIQQA